MSALSSSRRSTVRGVEYSLSPSDQSQGPGLEGHFCPRRKFSLRWASRKYNFPPSTCKYLGGPRDWAVEEKSGRDELQEGAASGKGFCVHQALFFMFRMTKPRTGSIREGGACPIRAHCSHYTRRGLVLNGISWSRERAHPRSRGFQYHIKVGSSIPSSFRKVIELCPLYPSGSQLGSHSASESRYSHAFSVCA